MSNGPADEVIRVERLAKSYVTAAGPFPALKGVDLAIRRGEAAEARPVAPVTEQANLVGPAIGQAGRDEKQRQRLTVDGGARLRGATRVGDIVGMANLAVVDRRDAARKRQRRGRHHQVARTHHFPTTPSGKSSPNTRW